MKKKVLFLLLTALVMLCSSANAVIIKSGQCGDNITWTLTEDYTLTLSGSGAMTGYFY